MLPHDVEAALDDEAARFIVLERVIRALRAAFEERELERDGDRLRCAECRAQAPPDARRWRVYLDIDGEAVPHCPECSEREFGDEG